MFTLINLMSQMRNWNRPVLAARHVSRGHSSSEGVAHELLCSAEERAGNDPREAEELRQAARAYLSVVR